MQTFKLSLAAVLIIMFQAVPSLPFAATTLVEHDQGIFPVAASKQVPVSFLELNSQEGLKAAAVMPMDIAGLDLVSLRWPKQQLTCTIAVGQSPWRYGEYAMETTSYITVMVGEGEPQLVPLSAASGENGVLARLCVWPAGKGEESELICLMTFAGYYEDSEVVGFAVSQAGIVTPVDTSRAKTLFGWFTLTDLDDDSNYELITSRNLDGCWGGFFYHSVRGYDPVTRTYRSTPSNHLDYFKDELKWLDWIITTRGAIMSNPQAFMNNAQNGPVYLAEYQGVKYTFDSIIEIPETTGVANAAEYNADRREAFQLVTTYRNELTAWLEGGTYPGTWKLIP